MKKLLFVFLALVLLSCEKQNKKSVTKQEQENISPDERDLKIEEQLLNGVWAESEDENALFEITDDTLRYVEFYETPYTFTIKDNMLIMITDDLDAEIPPSKIIKLTSDSLILRHSSGDITKLYNRRE